MSFQSFALTGLTLLSALLLAGCGRAEPPAAADANTVTQPPQNLPEPPAPMRSDTHIYSGGWLILGDGSEPLFDALVVVREGKIVALGKRGEVDVPADSLGIDASGKWILPGSLPVLQQAFAARSHDAPLRFQSNTPLAAGNPAEFVLLNSNPLRDPEAFGNAHGVVVAGELELND